MSTLPLTNDDSKIWDTWLSLYRLPVVTVADETGVFAALTGSSLTTEQLAAQLNLDARALGIHLGALAAQGYVEKRLGRWRATALTRTWLHPDAEGYYGPAIHGFRQSVPLHAQLLQTVQTGASADAHPSAAAEWERGEMTDELAQRITAYMNAHSRAAALAVAAQPVFADVQSLMDVGGGSAIFSIQLAQAWPQLRATVAEIHAVANEADRYIAEGGVADRVATTRLNMFTDAWPGGHDAHFFSNIFHDWSDATCRLLAQKSFEALPSGGQIFLHEMLVDDDQCGPLAATLFSLLMLLGTRGKQYSLPELDDILGSAGFKKIEAVRTGGGYYSLVSARKP